MLLGAEPLQTRAVCRALVVPVDPHSAPNGAGKEKYKAQGDSGGEAEPDPLPEGLSGA